MDICEKINTIPQFTTTCWFNAILTVSFYSELMRKLMITKISKKWKNTFLFKFFKTILKYSNIADNKKIIKLFHKIKPETIILYIFNKYFNSTSENLLYLSSKGWSSTYISLFLQLLGVKTLDIINIDNNIYLNYFKYLVYKNENSEEIEKNKLLKEIKEIPEVILVLLTEGLQYKNEIYLNEISKIHNNKLYNKNNNKFKDFINLKEIVKYNDNLYKLDSILLDNYNILDINSGHVIAGITCNNNRYIYNGWNVEREDELEESIIVNPCKLIKFDWMLNKETEFCINRSECKINKEIDKEDLCFSFNKKSKILVYVKINDLEELEEEEIKSASVKTFSKSTKKILKEGIKKKYNLANLNEIKIKELLIKYNLNFNTSLNVKILKKILLNYYIKKELEQELEEELEGNKEELEGNKEELEGSKEIKKEYFTKLEITNFNEKEIIKINEEYYLKRNLFYYLFNNNIKQLLFIIYNKQYLLDPNNKIININKLKEIYSEHIKIQDIIKIFNSKSINSLIYNLNIYINTYNPYQFIIKKEDIKKYILILLILFGTELLSRYLINENKNYEELIEYLSNIKEEKEKEEIIRKFKFLEIYEIKKIEDIIQYIIKQNKILRGGKKILKIYKNVNKK